MSKIIVVANSGEVLSTHKNLELAEKSAKKLGGYVIETESVVKKGDLVELPVIDDVETFEAEQELKECDEVAGTLKISVVFTVVDRNTNETVFSKTRHYDIESAKTLAQYDSEWKHDFDLIRADYKNVAGFPAQYACDFHFRAPLSQKKSMLKKGFFSDTSNSLKFEIINYHTVLLDNDDVVAHQPTQNISRKITYASGAWIEIDYRTSTATVSDNDNADLVELGRLVLTGFEECKKATALRDLFNKTVTYIAKPQDSRCSWWCVQVPQGQELDGKRINAPFLKRGADLELKLGDMLIDSEANHHRKNRGYSVVLIVCDGEKIKYLHPTAQRKAFIKAHGGQGLMHENGDVNGCVRMAVWLRRQSNLKLAIERLLVA